MLRDVHPIHGPTAGHEQPGPWWWALRVRVFEQFLWLEAGSDKVTLSRPGKTPGWCPIPPTSTLKGHNAIRWAADSIEHLVK
jgi:hypothetical protein